MKGYTVSKRKQFSIPVLSECCHTEFVSFFFFLTVRDFICFVLVNSFAINNKDINYFITRNISFFFFCELN
jgi:hypothetical protein